MTWPTDAEFAALVLSEPCFRCGVASGEPCLTDPGQDFKWNPYTGRKAYHQRRLDTFWKEHQGEYQLPAALRMPGTR